MKPGARVVCIDDRFPPEILERLQGTPKNGEIYTIRDIIRDTKTNKITGITLVGVHNPNAWMPCTHGMVLTEYFFRLNRFVMVEEEESVQWTAPKMDIRQLQPVARN
jgi:hypothetical protein